MTSLVRRIILLSSILLLLLALPAGAAVPRLFDVTDDIAEPERTELKTRKDQLLLQRDALNDSLDAYNARCLNITEELSIAYECKKNYTLLEININTYAISVHKFNRDVFNAPRTAPAPGITKTPKTAPVTIKKPEPAPVITKKPEPAPVTTKKPEPAPVATKTPEPVPVITKKPEPAPVITKTPEPVPVITKKPEPAPVITKKPEPVPVITKTPETAPVTTKTPKPDPRITNIKEYLMFARDRTADVRKKNSAAVDEMAKTAETYAASTAQDQKFKMAQQEIYKRRDTSLKLINKHALRHMSEEMERLKREGHYNAGDDLVEKERSDPRFQKTVQQVLTLQYEAEHDVHKRTLEEMRAVLEELRGTKTGEKQ